MTDLATPLPAPRIRMSRRIFAESLATHAGLWLLFAGLFVFLSLPLVTLLIRSFEDKAGAFAGLVNFAQYVQSPALARSTLNTLTFACLTTLITIPLAFAFAYAIQRTRIPAKGLWRSIALIPILAPSLLAALSFIYLFGNQGALKFVLGWFGVATIYGLPGMVLAMSFAAFPHAVMILLAAMALSDARLYEAAEAMGTRTWRRFVTITLPGAKYGLISAAMVVFTMAVSEFGVPKVIGGNYPVLAIDIYKQVIGQQNFQMGAVVGLVLLLPAVVAFAVDQQVRRRQQALMSARSVPYVPRRSRGRDRLALAFVVLVSAAMLTVMGMAVFGSFVKLWPYNLSLTLAHYTYGFEEANVEHAYRNSLVMAGWCAAFGAAITFAGAYWVEKTRGAEILRPLIRLQAMLPMAVPGMVLGIGYILFFNAPANPLNFLYGTMAILVCLHGRPLLLVEPPDRRDRAEAAGRRVRVGVRIAQGPVLQDVLAGDRAGVPADDPRHFALLFRERDDDDLGGRVPLLAEDDAGGDLDPAARRGGRDRFRRRDGHADRRHVGRRDGRHARGGGAAARAHAEVARAGEDVNAIDEDAAEETR